MTLRISNKSLSKFYSAVLAWSSLLGIYRSFIPGVSISEFILLICAVLSIFLARGKSIGEVPSAKWLLLFAVYCLSITLFALLVGEWYDTAWFQRVIRFLFYIFIVLFMSGKLFDKDAFFQHIDMVSWLLFGGIIYQYIMFYGTGRYIRLYGNHLPLMTEELLNVNFENIFGYSAFRPSSFLTEPAHIAQLSFIPFTYNLYKASESKNRKNTITASVIGLTILLSKSLWGYCLLGLVFLFWILDTTKKAKTLSWYITAPIVLGTLLYVILNSSLWLDTFSRIDFHNLQGSLAFTGRFTGYEDFFDLPLGRIIFGSGFGAVIYRQNPNSIIFTLVGEGVVGIILLAFIMITALKYSKEKWKRTICVGLIILLFGSNILFSLSFSIILSLLYERKGSELMIDKRKHSRTDFMTN